MDRILTITVPAYNVEKYLPEVLPTFLDESIISDIEVLIVNDGSQDKTREIAERYQKDYPESIRVINKKNGGHGSAINVGIKHASGKYLKVFDGDDWADTKALCRFIDKLQNCDVDLVITPYNTVDAKTKEIIRTGIYDSLSEGAVYGLDALERYHSAMHSYTYKTSILRLSRQIDENCYYVDTEYVIFPLKYVSTIAYIEETIYQYRVGSPDQSMAIGNLIKNREMHKRVLEVIIDYYKRENLGKAARNIVGNRILELSDVQMTIYLEMGLFSDSKRECEEFTSFIQKEIPELCGRIPGKCNQIVIRSNNIMFGPVIFARRLRRYLVHHQ